MGMENEPMKSIAAVLLAWTTLVALPVNAAAASASLRGSPASMQRQNQVAKGLGYTFVDAPAQVDKLVDGGELVAVRGNRDFGLAKGVSYPFARPVVVSFLERLGSQYRNACGERLVVTSLTRPHGAQPSNAHVLSVHPTGMAVDLRISRNAECREWLEGTLLSLENRGLLDITRERRPPHYHVAVFPKAYAAYLDTQRALELDRERAAAGGRAMVRAAVGASPTGAHVDQDGASAGRGSEKGGPLMVLLLIAVALASRTAKRRPQPEIPA